MRTRFLTVLICVVGLLPAFSLSQNSNSADPNKTINFRTKLGSFVIEGNEDNPPTGTLRMTFEGTVLVNGLDGTIERDGDILLEYENEKMKRQVFSGKGTIVIKGEFRKVQWFGKNLTQGVYTGDGLVTFRGEFDKDLQTGEYWFASDPEKRFWGTHGQLVVVPKQQRGPQTAPLPKSQPLPKPAKE